MNIQVFLGFPGVLGCAHWPWSPAVEPLSSPGELWTYIAIAADRWTSFSLVLGFGSSLAQESQDLSVQNFNFISYCYPTGAQLSTTVHGRGDFCCTVRSASAPAAAPPCATPPLAAVLPLAYGGGSSNLERNKIKIQLHDVVDLNNAAKRVSICKNRDRCSRKRAKI